MSGQISKLGHRLVVKASFALASCLMAMSVGAPSALADFGISQFGTLNSLEGHFSPTYSGGVFSRQAGAHADFSTKLLFSGTDSFRNVRVDLPPGLVGDPTAVPQCSSLDLSSGAGRNANCPPSSQVGVIKLQGDPEIYSTAGGAAIYNIVPPPDLPALLAFNYQGTLIFLEPHVRPTDYGIYTTVTDASIGLPIHESFVKIWGVPADPSHGSEGGLPSAERKSFLSNPTSCPSTPSRFTADVNSWQDPAFAHAEVTSDIEGTPFKWEGCNRVPFAPSMRVDPGSHATAAPTGLEVTVSVPPQADADAFAPAHVRKTVVTLPRGFSISPAAASGIGGCSEAQIGIGSNDAPTCPGSSSLGTVKVKSPVLEDELDGEIFLAKQNENPFHNLLTLYLAIKGPGFYIKLPGATTMDQQTGQVTSTFDNTPQLPFESLKLSFRGGAKAPLVSPDKCGTYVTQIEMTSWASSVPVHLESPVTIDENCNTGGFDPKLNAGSTNPVAGSNTPFNVRITRNDGEQNIFQISSTLPPGLVARLAGIPLCEGAAAASGNCPTGSDIGSVTVGGGAGSQPLYIPEPSKPRTHIYFGGPYKGAPYSMVFSVPAQAGPFDLGVVNVRAAVYLDPTTAQVTVKSDPLPQILQGVPINYRDMRIEVTKPSFTLNPTNCNPKRFESNITSDEGKTADPTSRFQVSDCASLDFAPKLAISLKGGTKRTQYPALRAVLTQPTKNQANIAKVSTTLPHSEFLANEHIQTICTRVQYAAHNCPAKSVYGHATAWSPLLDKPIDGPVYLRSSNHELPDLVADLGGAIDIDLVGRVDSQNGGIRTTFETVPDAPVSKFVLAMQGGKKGLLVNSTNICKGPHRAKILVDGQNGKTADQSPVVKAQCGKVRKGAKKRG